MTRPENDGRGQISALSAADINESALLLSEPSPFASQWMTDRFRQIGPLVFERSVDGWELHLGNAISLTLPDGPLFSGDYPGDVQKDVLLKALADAGYTMGREHMRLSGEIRSLRAKLMLERANTHEWVASFVDDGCIKATERTLAKSKSYHARARRLRAEAARIDGGGR